MVSFHIHTNGNSSEEGERQVVSPIIINAVWIGVAVTFWSAAIFLIITAIHEIVK